MARSIGDLLMHATLQPNAMFLQQLQVIAGRDTIGYMTAGTELEAFANRINSVLDEMGVPPKGKNRQNAVAKLFSVSQNAARKWLEGEGFPKLETGVAIAKWANVQFDWLMTGRPPKRLPERYPSPAIARAASVMEALPDQSQWLAVRLIEQLPKPTDETDDPSEH